MDSIIVQPLMIKTPVLEVEADYGNPIVDWLMIVSVVVVIFLIKKAVDKWRQ